MEVKKKILTVLLLTSLTFCLVTLCSADSFLDTNRVETKENTHIVDNKIGIHKQLYPSQIKVGDSYQSFAHLALDKTTIEGAVLLDKNSKTGEETYVYVPYGYFGFDPRNVDLSSVIPEFKDKPTRLCQVEAPEGSYFMLMNSPLVFGENNSSSKEECSVLSVMFIPRPNRQFTDSVADFPLSEVVIGDSFEKLLLFNPIPIKSECSEKNSIQYKMFVENGEYVYTLQRENEMSEFYITDIQFTEAT
ncbi:MAG: hypothetical protein J6D87_05350 [Clostridia bacterium]|nr:hypothetical protein [Clostridia bacterium]